jgi:hypothetical protein
MAAALIFMGTSIAFAVLFVVELMPPPIFLDTG